MTHRVGSPVTARGELCLDSSPVAPPKRKTGGRTTPKGTVPGQPARSDAGVPTDSGAGDNEVRRVRSESSSSTPPRSSRYTPPIPPESKTSPQWVPVLMLALLILGVIVIMLRNLVFSGNNWLLLVGLGSVMGGLYTATKWR